MKVFYIAFLVVLMAGYALQFLRCHEKYRKHLIALNKEDFSLKAFMPPFLGLAEQLNLSASGSYGVRLGQKLILLYGNRHLKFYTLVHWALKCLYGFIGMVLSTFFCLVAAIGTQGIVLIPAAGALLFFLADKTLDERCKERKRLLERDFPDFLSKLVLLVNAGLTTRQAIERIASEKKTNVPLYDELETVLSDIRAGMPEGEAFAEFSERCRIRQITHFVSILQQNMKLGGGQMLYELKRMGTECWEMRKLNAKQLGETASSKLMLPLCMMFLAVILICMAPALLQLKGL